MERQRQKQIAKNACVQACRLKDILKDPFQLWLWPHPAQHMLQEPNAPLQSTDRHPVHHPNPEWGGARWQAAQLKVTKLFPFPWRRLKAALTSLTGCPEQRAHCFSGQFSSSKSMCVNVRNSLWLSSECQSLVFFFFSKLESMIWWLKKKKSTPFEIPSFHLDGCMSFTWSIYSSSYLAIGMDLDHVGRGWLPCAGSPLPLMLPAFHQPLQWTTCGSNSH